MKRKKIVYLEENIIGKNQELLYEANIPYPVFYSEFIDNGKGHTMSFAQIKVNFRVVHKKNDESSEKIT